MGEFFIQADLKKVIPGRDDYEGDIIGRFQHEISENLIKAIEKRKWSYKNFSDRVAPVYDMKYRGVVKNINGEASLRAEDLLFFEKVLNIDRDEILGGSKNLAERYNYSVIARLQTILSISREKAKKDGNAIYSKLNGILTELERVISTATSSTEAEEICDAIEDLLSNMKKKKKG